MPLSLTRSLRGKCSNTDFFWSVFSCTCTEYGDLDLRSQYPYSTQNIGKYGPEKKPIFGHFSRNE